jgi:formylglycine-generating enzyme required for sulfatase activity
VVKSDTFVSKFKKDTIIQHIELVFVPKGPFKKGLYCEEQQIHYDYWIGRFEITNQQFYQFLIEALQTSFLCLENNILYYNYRGDNLVPVGRYRVKMWDHAIYLENDSIKLNSEYALHPVISVTWFGCKAFCDFYGFDLPTEAEWEKAARGDQCLWFPWGNDIDSSYANYFNSKDPFEPGTTPVGFYNGQNYKGFQTSNAVSVYGCYDMSGNAWEWTKDYISSRVPFYLGKGGGANYHTPAFLQIYYISIFGPEATPPLDMCNLTDGFRVVKK